MAQKKVYFCGSIRAGRQDADLYHSIIRKIDSCGAKVLTEFVGWGTEEMQKQNEKRGLKDDKAIYDQDMAFLQETDAVVAEVTQPSLGVGFEIGRAVAWGKKILCLYRPQEGKRLSAMIAGADNGTTFVVKNYQVEEMEKIIEEFVASL